MLDQIREKCQALSDQGKFQEAWQIWDRASVMSPNNPVAHFGMAQNLGNMGLNGTALAIMRMSVQVSPTPDNWYLLGQCLRRTQDYEAARRAYDEALKLGCHKELLKHLYTAYAGTYVNGGEPEKGMVWIEKALEIEPDFFHAVNTKALLLLESGRYEEGWPLYAKRWRSPGYLVREYPGINQWDGKTKVETLFIHAEQGLGDEILFASAVPPLRDFAGKIVGECQGRLIELFRRSFPYVTWYATPQEVLASNEFSAADPLRSAWYRMGDLLSVFGAQPKAFLKADPVKVAGYRARLQALGPGPYVGFSWKGGSPETHERYRNAPKDRWRELISKCKGTAVSVQYGAGDKFDIPHWDCAINDLDEFAALIAALDLVISCCGASVHFAGGLGTPCWAAVPKECAWRYAGDEMRWYDSVKMYKGTWDQVFYGLGLDLEKC